MVLQLCGRVDSRRFLKASSIDLLEAFFASYCKNTNNKQEYKTWNIASRFCEMIFDCWNEPLE